MRRVAPAALSVLLVLSLAAPPVAAGAAPVSDESYQEATDALAASIERSRDIQRGRVLRLGDGSVVPIDRSMPATSLSRSRSALPSSHISPYSKIKSQVGDTCWAYATIGALESDYMAQRGIAGQGSDAVDFSEAQVVYGSYNGEAEGGVFGGRELTDSDNDHLVTDDGVYGFLTASNMFTPAASLAAGRGVSYESDVPIVMDDTAVYLGDTVIAAAENFSLSRLRLDSMTCLPGVFVPVDDESPAAGLVRDDAALDAWKRAILGSGAIVAGYRAPATSEAQAEYYHPDADEAFGDAGAGEEPCAYQPNYWMYDPNREDFYDVMAGHALVLVGWDDSYSRWNFATPLVREDGAQRSYDPDVATVEERDGVPYIVPRGDGAFVAKNSWGTELFDTDGTPLGSVGDEGIFYFSYWEGTYSGAYAYGLDDAEDGSSYDIVQQYDGAMVDEYLETGDAALEGANVFVAEGDQELEALGLWAYENAAVANVKVYVGLTDPDDPESGTLACEQTTRMDMGYQTLELDAPVSVGEGEAYSVVVSMSATLGSGEEASFLPIECSENTLANREARIYSSEGETFVSLSEGGGDGVWVDTADVTLPSGARMGNLAVKAFSNPAGDPGTDGPGDPDKGTGDGHDGGGQGDGGTQGGGQTGTGEVSSAPRPAAGLAAPSDGESLPAASDAAARPLPLAVMGAVACSLVPLARRRLRSR